jgi:hypothetical protein
MQCSRNFFYSNFPRESIDSKMTFPDHRIQNSSLYLWIKRCMIYWNQWHNCNTFFPQQILPMDRSRSMLVQMFWLFFFVIINLSLVFLSILSLVFLSILAFFLVEHSLEFVQPNFSNDIFHRNSNFLTSKFLKYNFWTVSGPRQKQTWASIQSAKSRCNSHN